MREAVLIASPGQQPLPRARGDPEANQRLAGVDPDAESQRRPADGLEALGVLDDAQARAHGPLGVVLVGGGNPEDADHGVADELLHHPAVGLDLGPGHRGVGREHLVDVLGVGGLRGRGEPDQVAEQRGDDLAFLGDGPGRSAEGRGALHRRTSSRPGSRDRRKGTQPRREPMRTRRRTDRYGGSMKARGKAAWWALEDLNLRPLPCQGDGANAVSSNDAGGMGICIHWSTAEYRWMQSAP